MPNGTIKTIRAERGFGFISPEGDNRRGDDLFFHASAVQDVTFDELQEGQQVSFDEEPDPRDPRRQRAVHVRLVEE